MKLHSDWSNEKKRTTDRRIKVFDLVTMPKKNKTLTTHNLYTLNIYTMYRVCLIAHQNTQQILRRNKNDEYRHTNNIFPRLNLKHKPK